MARSKSESPLVIYISDAELALLKKLDFPCSEDVLATATATEEGIELTGSAATSRTSRAG